MIARSWIAQIDRQGGARLRRAPVRSAFTLVEILVVVAVITLLVAILIPSLAKSRAQAKAVVCRSNLKEWARVLTMYTSDQNNTLPYEDRGAEFTHGRICWFDAADKYFTATGGSKGDEDVKVCPIVRRDRPEREESYRMNSKLAEESELPERKAYYRPYRKLDTLDRPTQTVLLFDGDVGGDRISFKGRWRLSDDDVNYRHMNTTNILFTDWHLEYFRKDVLKDKSKYNQPVVWQPADMGPWDPDPAGP